MLHDPGNVNINLLRQRGKEIRRASALLARYASLPAAEFFKTKRLLTRPNTAF